MFLLHVTFKVSLITICFMAGSIAEELDSVVTGFMTVPSISVFKEVIGHIAICMSAHVRLEIVQDMLSREAVSYNSIAERECSRGG